MGQVCAQANGASLGCVGGGLELASLLSVGCGRALQGGVKDGFNSKSFGLRSGPGQRLHPCSTPH